MDSTDADTASKDLDDLVKLCGGPWNSKVKHDVGKAILERSNLGEFIFSHIPGPKIHEERFLEGGYPPFELAYNHAFNVLKCLGFVRGEDNLRAKYNDPLSQKLLKILDETYQAPVWVDMSRGDKVLFRGLFRHMSGNLNEMHSWGPLNQHTRSVIGYFYFAIRGRRDADSAFLQPPANINFAEAAACPSPDLSRLSLGSSPRKCANCFAANASHLCECCQPDTESGKLTTAVYCNDVCRAIDLDDHEELCPKMQELSRLTVLLKIACHQFLMSRNYGTHLAVTEANGMVKVVPSAQEQSNHGSQSTVSGSYPDLDFSLPMAHAAINAFNCRQFNLETRCLLEYFFRSSCTSIEFLTFTPKNAHIAVDFPAAYFRYNTEPSHTVVALEVGSCPDLILDITAAQYGWKENLALREVYTRCRVDSEFDKEECVAPDGPRPATKDTLQPAYHSDRVRWLARCVAEEIVEVTEEFMADFNGGLNSVLQISEPRFKEACKTYWGFLMHRLSFSDRDRHQQT